MGGEAPKDSGEERLVLYDMTVELPDDDLDLIIKALDHLPRLRCREECRRYPVPGSRGSTQTEAHGVRISNATGEPLEAKGVNSC